MHAAKASRTYKSWSFQKHRQSLNYEPVHFRHKRFKDIMHSNYLIDEYDDQFDNESDSHFDDSDERFI